MEVSSGLVRLALLQNHKNTKSTAIRAFGFRASSFGDTNFTHLHRFQGELRSAKYEVRCTQIIINCQLSINNYLCAFSGCTLVACLLRPMCANRCGVHGAWLAASTRQAHLCRNFARLPTLGLAQMPRFRFQVSSFLFLVY